jgi:predicted SAM-dependent methyltransferase
MKLEIGGGSNFSRGDDWINLDMCPEADIRHNLDVMPWPVADDAADQIYTSHCIEHVEDSNSFLFECARIGRIGCEVEIRCPAPFSEMAFVSGHKSVFSPQHARNAEIHFPKMYWLKAKRLRFVSHIFQASEKLNRAKAELPFLRGLSDQQIMEWIPGTAHESVFKFAVQANEYVG